MKKMWAGVTDGNTSKIADDFNSSISFDSRMFAEDITGSMAHSEMLCKCGIITEDECEAMLNGLNGILDDLYDGRLVFDPECEDIHMFVEQILTERIGDIGKKLHTARSRNDQVALDIRMYLRGYTDKITVKLLWLMKALTDKAEENKDAVMPGYTHLQRAQPITFGHQLMAYVMMLERDISRLNDCRKRINICPIGSCALAGTTFNTDRIYESELLGFDSACRNSLDGVSDRDFCVELLSDIAIIMMHLSRLSEELVMMSSWEAKFITLSDDFTTGSSIMPQKKNPDMAELIRGKTGRTYGNLTALLTTLKGLPLAYNKDMQEDKESVFDSCDTLEKCILVMTPMIKGMKVNREKMLEASQNGFINATDLADYLVKKGMPFREAYKISGGIVNKCMNSGKVLETLGLKEYRSFSELFGEDVYDAVNLKNCVERRNSYGGTSIASVTEQIKYIRAFLKENGII